MSVVLFWQNTWDQNFPLKIFLIPSQNDLILCVLLIGIAKNTQILEKLVIFTKSYTYTEICTCLSPIPIFGHF